MIMVVTALMALRGSAGEAVTTVGGMESECDSVFENRDFVDAALFGINLFA